MLQNNRFCEYNSIIGWVCKGVQVGVRHAIALQL